MKKGTTPFTFKGYQKITNNNYCVNTILIKKCKWKMFGVHIIMNSDTRTSVGFYILLCLVGVKNCH